MTTGIQYQDARGSSTTVQQHVRRIPGSLALYGEEHNDRETEVSAGFAISYATITELHSWPVYCILYRDTSALCAQCRFGGI